MNYSFEYIDIILLAMIAGFIFLRLRGILGKRTGHEENLNESLDQKDFFKKNPELRDIGDVTFDKDAQENFLNGAKIAYEQIITSFSKGNLKEIENLIDKKVLKQFNEAISERKNKGLKSETTFVGIDSATIKEHEIKSINFIEVTVDFVSEIISCVKDKNNKILSGDPKKVKKVTDCWKFSKNIKSNNPNWLLIDTRI